MGGTTTAPVKTQHLVVRLEFNDHSQVLHCLVTTRIGLIPAATFVVSETVLYLCCRIFGPALMVLCIYMHL